MIRSFYILIFLSGLSFMAIFLSGCSGKPSDSRAEYEEQYLVRVGESTATLFDFNKALEIAETAYPYNLLQNPDIFRKIQMRTLQQIIEEKLLQETARDLNIVLSDSEVEKVVSEMKSDYPKEVFEQILLENAVPYKIWKKRIKARLLMKKVLENELVEKIEITREDISKYYAQHYVKDGLKPESNKDSEDLPNNLEKDTGKRIIKELRMKKAEQSYKPWIKKLREKYIIEINRSLWERVVKGIDDPMLRSQGEGYKRSAPARPAEQIVMDKNDR